MWPCFWWFRLVFVWSLFLSSCQAGIIRRILGQLPPRMYGTPKRGIDEAFENSTILDLERRQDTYEDELYYLSSTMVYMATPYGSCNNDGGGADSVCPTDYICVCQKPGSSMCLPTLVATKTDCSTPY